MIFEPCFLMLYLLSLIIVTLITELKTSTIIAVETFKYEVEVNNKTDYMGICREITDNLANISRSERIPHAGSFIIYEFFKVSFCRQLVMPF